ncbi:MAG TPA: NmrA family NAD(P)-binding protein [Cyclobacteriaceae bacterium]
MKDQTILVLGGTGKTGRRVAQRLTAMGRSIRIGSRNESPAFDWENSTTWPNALKGMNAVYLIFQPDVAVPGATDVIREFTSLARKNGIQKLVFLSGRGEEEAMACEQIVIDSGINYTIVRSDWFNQNFSESFFLDPILAGHVAMPRAEALVPFVDADDIADVVVASFTDVKHSNQMYELTGPRLLTFRQVVEEIAQATKRDIVFESVSQEDYVKMLREYKVPEDYVWLVNYLFSEILDGRNENITSDVERVLGRKAKDFSTYVKETAPTGVWNG